ncbi:hypothetical protein RAA17_16795 [Komagataeibacter rhaeticus]|nr:hypothetical protein [Komagataeibacter rhaeticus]
MTQAHIATVVQAAQAGTDMDLIVQPGADGAPARWQAVACDGPGDGTGRDACPCPASCRGGISSIAA